MSHNRKLGKPTDQRIAMLRAMTTYLLENGQIKTTVSRAKEVAPMAEKMITLAKNANLANYRKALSYLTGRMWPRSCLTRSAPSTPPATAATPAS